MKKRTDMLMYLHNGTSLCVGVE